MTAGAFSCQCREFGAPEAGCGARATQEDLLCDTCREGCSLAMPASAGRGHMRADSLSFTLAPGVPLLSA